MEKEEFKVQWQDKEIGVMSNLECDMWYVDSTFDPNDSVEAKNFLEFVKDLNFRKVDKDPPCSTIITFGNQPALVYEYNTETKLLSVRRLFESLKLIKKLIKKRQNGKT